MSEGKRPDWVSRLARLIGPAQQIVTLVVLLSTLGGYFVHNSYGNNHAAIAISFKTLTYFTSSVHDTRSQARKDALAKCREGVGGNPNTDCKIAVWFYDGCGALAMDSDKAWGTDWAGTIKVAEKQAIERCERHSYSGKCDIVTSFCSI